MVQAPEGQPVERRVHVESVERLSDSSEVQIAQFDAFRSGRNRFVLGDDRYSGTRDVIEVVVKRPGGLRRGNGGETGPQVVLQCPMARAAAGDHSRQ